MSMQCLARQQHLISRPLRQRRQVGQANAIAAAIHLVRQNRTADAGKVNADLVSSSGADSHFQKSQFFEPL